jgi:PAS domain S-box-containing protein
VRRVCGVIQAVRLQDLGTDRVLESVRDAVLAVDVRSGRIVLWNAAASRIFGYSSSEALAHNWTVIVPERLKAKCTAGMARYRDTGHGSYIDSHAVLELPAVRKGGEEITIEIALSPIETVRDLEGDKGRFVLAVVRDVTGRKDVERAIKESEARFRSLVQNTSDIITLLEADGTVRYISPAIESMTGYKPEEQIGIKAFGAVHPEDRERASSIFAEVLKRPGLHPPLEFRVPHKDGSWRHVEHIVNNLLDDPAVRGVVVTSRDITERKQAEVRIQEADLRYRALVEHIPAIVYIEDVETHATLYDSPHIEVMLGYPADTCKKDPHYWAKVLHPQDRSRVMAAEVAATEHGEFKLEYRVLASDGHVVWLRDEAKIILDEEDRPRFWQGVIFDITERKRAEEEARRLNESLEQRVAERTVRLRAALTKLEERERGLRESERRFKQLFENSADALFVHDEQGRFVDCNAEACRALGYPREELLQLSVADVAVRLISEDERQEKRGTTLWERAMQGEPGRIVGFEENELRHKDGTIFPVEVGVGAIEYEGRQLIFASVRDTTERKRAEEELRRLNDELEQRVRQRTAQLEAFNSELEAFSYSVSHDLRAPLRAIDGFSQILLEDYKDRLDEEARGYLRRTKDASQRMGQLIDDLLDLSRMTRGEMSRERVDLSALARKIVDELRRVQPERQVEAAIEQGLVANGDARLLRVVLENLLGNAWKFTRDQPHPRIEFGSLEYERTLTYFVRDNGVGFEMAYSDKLFGAFQRLHRMSEFEGTGIGLATVQRIINRHGGRVWARSEVGKGATFFFTLQRHP